MNLNKMGYIAVRRIMLEAATAPVFLSLNDDSIAHPGLIDAHLALHDAEPNCIVAGDAHWKRIEQPNLFDRLMQETDLIFFHAQHAGAIEPYEIGFRNVYGLNFSARTQHALRTGGFPDLREIYGYDDIELAHRLATQTGARLLFQPRARVTHDHRFLPSDLIAREKKLGFAAWHYAQLNPDFAHDLFGRDITTPQEIESAKSRIERDHKDAARIEESFLALNQFSADTTDKQILPTIAQQWLLLKRWCWAIGLVEAAHQETAKS
jgi:hypothetical protein